MFRTPRFVVERILILSLILLCQAQEDLSSRARTWVERLRSDRIEEREEAALKLKELGKQALPELEKAAKEGDLDLATLAKSLLRVIGIQEQLSPALRRAMPGVEERLARGAKAAWSEAFLEAADGARHPELVAGDLHGLIAPTAEEAWSDPGKRAVFGRIREAYLQRAEPGQVVGFLKSAIPLLRADALDVLRQRRAPVDPASVRPILRDEVPGLRGAAARFLGEFRYREAIPEIVPLLREDSPEVRWNALGALVALRARSRSREILPLLGDPQATVRKVAIRAVEVLGIREGIPQVVSLLADGSQDIHLAALRCLVRLQARDQASEVLRLLKDDRFPREEVIQALCDLRAPGTARDLVGLLRGDGWGQGVSISKALCALQAKEVIPDLMELLGHPKAGVRQAAVDALAGLGVKEAAPRLVGLLMDENKDQPKSDADDVPWSAAHALRTLRAGEVVHDLVKILEGRRDRDKGTHRLAAMALGGLGRREAIPSLLKLLKSEDESDQLVAMSSLSELGAKEAIPDLVRMLKGAGSVPSMYAIPALVDLEAKEAIGSLLALVDHPKGQVRFPARRALLLIDPKSAAEEGRKLLVHDGADLRGFGADLVGSAGTIGDVAALAPLLRESDPEVRLSAIRAIQTLVPEEKLQDVLEDLKRRQGPLSEEVLKGFARPSAEEAMRRLRELIREGRPVHDAIAAAVGAGALEAAPLIRSLMPVSDSSGRKWLGLQLCRSGSREAIDDILEDAVEGGLDFVKLTPLNAIRSPEVWRRLQGKRLTKPLSGTREEVVEAIAREAGMTVEWPAPRLSQKFHLSVLDWESRRHRVPHLPGRPTLIGALDEALSDGQRLEAFLEPDRIRIAQHFDAVDQWVTWWAEEAGKEK